MTRAAPVRGLAVPAHALVTGASSGIGLAVVDALLEDPAVERLWAVSRRAATSAALDGLSTRHGGRLRRVSADLATDAGVQAVADAVGADGDDLHLVLNCAGILHGEDLQPEKSVLALRREALERVFALNAFAPILLVRALLPVLGPGAPRVVASLSARVASIGDNRLGGWYAYRASKAAQNQLLHTLAVEWRRTHPHATCVLLHPGTVDTALSRPFQARVPPGALLPPGLAARWLLDLVATLTPGDSGRFIAWDGQTIPW